MKIKSYKELTVYKMAMESAMEIFRLTKGFPREERYSFSLSLSLLVSLSLWLFLKKGG
uniref:Four helix bundle protein n=1 Tax=candidate division WOR-3 bacterium TaxID=2052148 RepID=A0A7C4XKS3_UNCW3